VFKLLHRLIHRPCGSFRSSVRDPSEMRSPNALSIEIAAGIRATETLSHRNTSATDLAARAAAVTCTLLVGQDGPFSTRANSHPVHEWSGLGIGGGVTSQSDAPGIKAFVVVLLGGSIARLPWLSANRRLTKAIVRVEVPLSPSTDSIESYAMVPIS
jgi:hypothetical protein